MTSFILRMTLRVHTIQENCIGLSLELELQFQSMQNLDQISAHLGFGAWCLLPMYEFLKLT